MMLKTEAYLGLSQTSKTEILATIPNKRELLWLNAPNAPSWMFAKVLYTLIKIECG